MRSSDQFALMVYTSVATVLGAVAMLMLVRATMLGTDAVEAAVPHNAIDVRLPPAEDPRVLIRLAFMPHDISAESEPEAAGSTEEPYEADVAGLPALREGSIAAPTFSWSTEVRPDAPAPQPSSRFSLLPTFRLPGQVVKPTPPRSYTLKSRLEEISPGAIPRLVNRFHAANAAWPPAEIALIAIKDEKVLEMHARQAGGSWTPIHRYRVLAASGGLGPKLRQGDKQVPEGIYSIAFLNPNSSYHVSLAVNYPNAFDREMAKVEGRQKLGGDIMIHGKNLSAGCLAMGDEAVEEIFVLAAQTGLQNVKLIIAPTDLRHNPLPATEEQQPQWLPKLYTEIRTAMVEYKGPPRNTGLLSFFMK